MGAKLKAPYLLSALIVILMVVKSMLGLMFDDRYHETAWIKATWFGNDWFDLVIAAPLMVVALVLLRRGSTRGLLLWLGMLGYSFYNFAFYLFGAALNAFFPLYVVTLILAAAALILALAHVDVNTVAASFSAGTPVRIVGGYLVCVAITFFLVWPAFWALYVFAGMTPPGGPEPFKLVAGLDLTVIMLALGAGGILLWRRQAWGYLIAAIAAIQGALYLLLLSANAVVSLARGLAAAPGQVSIWGALCVATAAAAVLLLTNVRVGERTPQAPDGWSLREVAQ